MRGRNKKEDKLENSNLKDFHGSWHPQLSSCPIHPTLDKEETRNLKILMEMHKKEREEEEGRNKEGAGGGEGGRE